MSGSIEEKSSALKSVLAAVSKLTEADARHLLRHALSRHGTGDVSDYVKELQDRAEAEDREELRREKVLADAKELPGVTVTVDGVESSGAVGKAKKGN